MRRRRATAVLAALVWTALVAGCAPAGRPPVVDRSPVLDTRPDARPQSYEVRRGDTLYSIAWRYQLDYRALARANGIGPPYTIYVGQRLRLAETGQASPRAPAAPRAPASPKAPAAPPSSAPSRDRPPVAAPRAPAGSARLAWQAPTAAPLQRSFGGGHRSLDYQLGPTDRIQAAGAGEVVYAGSGLGGFRHLVIVKHDPQYLSAYSFDRALAVREGQRIAAAEPIALASGADRVSRLRFEIRRNGDPVNPGLLFGR